MESEYTLNFQSQLVPLLQSISPACAQEPKKKIEIEMNNIALLDRLPLQHLSRNNLIQFSDHLLVDHPAIDGQHKSIFDLGIKVFEMMTYKVLPRAAAFVNSSRDIQASRFSLSSVVQKLFCITNLRRMRMRNFKKLVATANVRLLLGAGSTLVWADVASRVQESNSTTHKGVLAYVAGASAALGTASPAAVAYFEYAR